MALEKVRNLMHALSADKKNGWLLKRRGNLSMRVGMPADQKEYIGFEKVRKLTHALSADRKKLMALEKGAEAYACTIRRPKEIVGS